MPFVTLKQFLSQAGLASPTEFDELSKAWRVALDSGSQETLLSFIARERGVADDVFLQKLAEALGWPFVDLPKLSISLEARKALTTKVAFQHTVIPTQLEEGTLQVPPPPASVAEREVLTGRMIWR